MRLPAARVGIPLEIKSRELEFTFWPMKKTIRRWGVHSMLYAADPWGVITSSVNAQADVSQRASANSFVRQAKEYFTAAERAQNIETKPLLYYYSFLNLGKAISISRGRKGLVGKVQHGIASIDRCGHSPQTAELAIAGTASSGIPKFAVDELHYALEDKKVAAADYSIQEIIAQSVVAHRMWRDAFTQTRVERFLAIESIQFIHDAALCEVWLKIRVRRSTMAAQSRSVASALKESGLANDFRAVIDLDPKIAAQYHTFEQVHPVKYTHRPSDVVMSLIKPLRINIWQTITATPPYRRYYLYLSPANEKRMPQWLSIYSTIFWLGSLTRYQPVDLLSLLDGSFGPFFHEFLQTQPNQLLYLLASEVKEQDVTKASLV